MPRQAVDEKIQEKGERYAHSVITYSSRTGTSTGQYERIVVADAFVEGYYAAMRARREYDVHQLECHADCERGRHHKNCPWQKASTELFKEKF